MTMTQDARNQVDLAREASEADIPEMTEQIAEYTRDVVAARRLYIGSLFTANVLKSYLDETPEIRN